MSGLSSRPHCSGPAITRPVRHLYYSLISFGLAARLPKSARPRYKRNSSYRRGTEDAEFGTASLVNNNSPPPLGFSQVFIQKGLKVLCFDTDLQVLILNEIEEGSRVDEKRDASGLPALFCARNREMPSEGMPPPVFCKKSPQAIENKGWGWEKERQEISRVGKLLRD